MIAICSDMNRDLGNWLNVHPKVNTVVVVANHIFRAAGMYALMEILPGSFAAKCLIAGGASLFYRVTIERFCRFRFAMLSCVGAAAVKMPELAPLYIGAVLYESYTACEKLAGGCTCHA